jgi:DNA ligase-1
MTDHTQFKPMLAKDANLPKVSYPLAVQIKLDGIRASVVNGRLVSRTLKLIPNAEIQAALSRPEFEGLDGELIVGSPTADNCMQTTSSYVMAPNKTGEPWCYHVFDKWNESGTFLERAEVAASIVREAFHHPSGDLVMVPYKIAGNVETLEAIEEATVAEGHEGVIVRVLDAPYKFGRSGKTGPLLKIKRYVDFEAKVVGVYEEMHNANEAKRNELGRTERSTAKAGKVGKGTLGGLILVAINGDYEGVEFRCGTGFDRDTRAALWAESSPADYPEVEREGLNGRVAKVKYFPIGSKDKPRHPVFLDWRNMEVDG